MFKEKILSFRRKQTPRLEPAMAKSVHGGGRSGAGMTLADLMNVTSGEHPDQANVSTRQADAFYRHVSAVATAVDQIADAYASLRFSLWDGKQHTYGGRVIDLMADPSTMMSGSEFAKATMASYKIHGEVMIVAGGNVSLLPSVLEYVPITEVASRRVSGRFVDSIRLSGKYGNLEYHLRQDGDTWRYIANDSQELFWLRRLDPANPLTQGLSPLNQVASESRQFSEGSTANYSMQKNGGVPGIVLKMGDDDGAARPPSDDQKQQLRDQVNTFLTGTANTGRSLFVGNGWGLSGVEQVGMTPKDMQYADLMNTVGARIAGKYGIPLPKISGELMTLGNYQTSLEAFWDDAVTPSANMMLDQLTRAMRPRSVELQDAELSFDPSSVPALARRRSREALELSKSGVLTVNELRAMLGKEPIEGGEVLYQPGNLVAVGSDQDTSDEPAEPTPRKDVLRHMATAADDEAKRLAADYIQLVPDAG